MFLDRWSNYKEKIGKAVRDYKRCDRADCFKLQRRSDFRFWVDNGGIKESDFLHARDRKLGEHYQIIDKKLYRTKSCIFPSRLEWFVEGKKIIRSYDLNWADQQFFNDKAKNFSKYCRELTREGFW